MSRENKKYREVRDRVIKRDGKCQFTGCYSKKNLEVHHIIKYAKSAYLRYNPYNLLVLCRYHHYCIRGKEHLYAAEFMRKARENESRFNNS